MLNKNLLVTKLPIRTKSPMTLYIDDPHPRGKTAVTAYLHEKGEPVKVPT